MGPVQAVVWSWIGEAKRIWREVNGNMKASDYEPLIAANRVDAEKVTSTMKAVRKELDDKYVQFELAGDGVAIARLRKRVREAQEQVNGLDYARERLVAARDAAAAEEFAANRRARIEQAKQMGAQLGYDAEEIQQLCNTLGEAYLRYVAHAEQFVKLLPGKVEHMPAEFSNEGIGHRVDQSLFVATQGRLKPRQGSLLGTGWHELAKGPDLKKRVDIAATYVIGKQQKSNTTEPPEAA